MGLAMSILGAILLPSILIGNLLYWKKQEKKWKESRK
jgi:hypothetical protein